MNTDQLTSHSIYFLISTKPMEFYMNIMQEISRHRKKRMEYEVRQKEI